MAALGALRGVLAGSSMARGLAVASVQARVESSLRSATTPSSDKVDWTHKNYPTSRLGLIHYDLDELRMKRPAEHALALLLLRGAYAVCAMTLLNFIDAIALCSVLRGAAYDPLAPLYSLMTLGAIGPGALAAAWLWYHGVCESAGRSKTAARALLGLLCFLFLLFALTPSGNLHGIAGLAQTARAEHALAAGSGAAAVAYWHAVTVLESLFWGALCVGTGWVGWRTTLQQVAPPAAAAVVAPEAAAAAPAAGSRGWRAWGVLPKAASSGPGPGGASV